MSTIKGNQIRNARDINATIQRIAYQIYENNETQQSLVLAGINGSGAHLAKEIAAELKSISNLDITLVDIIIDKKNPRNGVSTALEISAYENKSIVVVDDVLNTGSTLIYAVNYFLKVPVIQIKTAVMVNRNHKNFPIKADFKGLSLSTSLREHINVILEGDARGIYLS